MRARLPSGFTLAELIIVMVISGVFLLTVGMLLVTSFESWMETRDLTAAESDIGYFRQKLEHQFHHAPAGSVSFASTAAPNDTLRFAAYSNGSNLLNQFTQNEYKVAGGNLTATRWDAQYIDGTLTPQSPWGAGGTAETVLRGVVSLRFDRADMEPGGETRAVSVTVVQRKNLPGGGIYTSSAAFAVRTRNRR